MTDKKGNFMKALKEIVNGPEEEAVNPVQESKATVEQLSEKAAAAPAAEAAKLAPTVSAAAEAAKTAKTAPVVAPAVSASAYNDLTIITEGTQIIGQMMVKGNVEIFGEIQGDVEAVGNVTVNGKIYGNVKGHCVEMSSCRVKGNISAVEDVTVIGDSILIGDILAKNVTVSGKVKGTIVADETASFNKEAMVVGDVESFSIAIEQGSSVVGALKSRRDNAAFKAFDEF